jgi:AraC-like DNA-binding protein
MYYKYKRGLKNRQSSIDNYQSNWLRIFIYGYLLAFLLTDLCRIGLYTFKEYKTTFVFFSFFGFFVYFILLFYRAISNPLIFNKIDEKNEPKTNTIPKHEAHYLLSRIRVFMVSNEPYLNPELTLKDLSLDLKIPERLLSGVINQDNNQNFYDFVNYFRVEKAKRLLQENDSKQKTIQEIIWDSGFNSKSTFNLAFKKFTGTTPSEFKKTQ